MKNPSGIRWGDGVAKTLGTARHKALIALLVEAREKVGMTQTDLATRLGEYQSFVARLESGQRRVDVVELIELAEILDFDPKVMVETLQATRDRS